MMGCLKVIITNGPEPVAKSANGFDLGHAPAGIFGSLFSRKKYPYLHNYLAYIRREGWMQVCCQPRGSKECVYTFLGSGRYKVLWMDENWVPDQSPWIREGNAPANKFLEA